MTGTKPPSAVGIATTLSGGAGDGGCDGATNAAGAFAYVGAKPFSAD